MTSISKRISMAAATALGGALFALPAAAHVQVTTGGLAGGLVHPFTGADHLLVILGVGALAASYVGRPALGISLAFGTAMVLGSMFILAGYSVPSMELITIVSIFVVGSLLVVRVHFGAATIASVVSILAFFHGMAFASEMSPNGSAVAYVFGLAMATATLLTIGWAGSVAISARMKMAALQ